MVRQKKNPSFARSLDEKVAAYLAKIFNFDSKLEQGFLKNISRLDEITDENVRSRIVSGIFSDVIDDDFKDSIEEKTMIQAYAIYGYRMMKGLSSVLPNAAEVGEFYLKAVHDAFADGPETPLDGKVREILAEIDADKQVLRDDSSVPVARPGS